MNNIIKTNNLKYFAQKLSKDTKVQYEFISVQKLYYYNINNKIINGLNIKDKIIINVNSDKNLSCIIGHETTHLFENTKDYKTLQNTILEYAKIREEYESRRRKLKKTYKGIETNIDNELTADLVGDYLFNNIKFLKNLFKNKNIFQKIYDKVKYLYKITTATSREKRKLEKVKYTFEKMYRNNKVQVSDKVKYSIQKDVKGNKYVRADRQVITGSNSLMWEDQIEKYINNKIRNDRDISVIASDEDVLSITSNTAGKSKFRNYYMDKKGNKHYMNDIEFYIKLSAEAHIDELGTVSKKINKKTVPDYKNHNFAKNGFDYRIAFFEDFDGNYYKLTMSIGKNRNINTIYNIGKIEQRKRPVISGSSVNNGANGSLTINNVPQSNIVVKSDTTNNYMQNSKKYHKLKNRE